MTAFDEKFEIQPILNTARTTKKTTWREGDRRHHRDGLIAGGRGAQDGAGGDGRQRGARPGGDLARRAEERI